jgi:hypothetical protein
VRRNNERVYRSAQDGKGGVKWRERKDKKVKRDGEEETASQLAAPPVIVELVPPESLALGKKLEALFAARPLLYAFSFTPTIRQLACTKPSPSDIARFYANRHSEKFLQFTRASGNARLGQLSRPVLDRECAAQHSACLREDLADEPDPSVVQYGDGFGESTVQRFVACVAPSSRGELPGHDIVEAGGVEERELIATKSQRSMAGLRNVYVIAQHMGAR